MNPYLIVSIVILAALVVIFFVTFVIARRMPKPEGCEDISISEENCGACQVADCMIKEKFDIKKAVEEEIKAEEALLNENKEEE